jgi:hypothetical protein
MQLNAIRKKHPPRLVTVHKRCVPVLAAISAMTLLGFAGLGSEAPLSYAAKLDLPVAAVGAAYSRANADAAGRNPVQFDHAAQAVSARCSFTSEPNGVRIKVDSPFARCIHATDGRTIEAAVPLPQKLLLISLLASSSSATGAFGLLAAQP